MNPIGQAIWKRIVKKNQTNATSVGIHHLSYAIYGDIWKHTLEKSQTYVTNVALHPQFEETFENPQWRKVKQMQPMQLCILWGKRLEETFENTQWGKAKQMQPVWFCKMFSPDNICIKYSYISSSQQYLCDYSTRFIFDKICWQQILLKSNQREM